MSLGRTFLLALPFVFVMQAMAGNGYVTLKDTSNLFYVKGNEIYSPDKKQLLYFQKGNIFFSGSTDEKQNIFLMTTGMNMATDQNEEVYEKDNRAPTFSFNTWKFYWGKNESEDLKLKNELIHIKRTGKWLAFYSTYNDSLLAYYLADSLSTGTAIITCYTLVKKYKLNERLIEKQAALPFEKAEYATIKPMWGNVTAGEWIWDGQILRPRWNVDPRFAWTYDGKTVKPMYANNIYEQYEWDGEIFKPVWRSNRAEEWGWDGSILKPLWDSDWANQYKMEGGVIRPWSNVHPEREWQMDGSIPIPLIILIVSGIAKAG